LPPADPAAKLARMKIGVLSDSHDHLPETREGLRLLLEHGAAHLVHCGDVGDRAIDLLAAACLEHGIRAHLARGNCDRFGGPDARFAPSLPSIDAGVALDFTLDGKRCAALHGHDPRPLSRTLDSADFDFVFVGHTHSRRDERLGRTRLLNPGSCARPRDGKPPSVLLLDLASGAADWLDVRA
jgi:uncharacterized protein